MFNNFLKNWKYFILIIFIIIFMIIILIIYFIRYNKNNNNNIIDNEFLDHQMIESELILLNHSNNFVITEIF
jgi:heme/copper-type cytochrome/quinol oxidase subunit 2